MRMVQCANGHFFDSEKNATCPYCQSAGGVGRTVGMDGGYEIGKTVGVFENEIGKTVAVNSGSNTQMLSDDEKTVALFHKKMQTQEDPVCGWLVVINGKTKGKDYKIHADNNYIGRSRTMDIAIVEDETVSREHHAVIAYDSRNKKFFFSPGEGRSIIRVNDDAVFSTVQIKDYDILEIGETKLLFRSLCGDGFDWKEVADE